MRNNTLLIVNLLVYLATLSSCKGTEVDNLKIGVISDIHYLSPKLMDAGSAISNYSHNGAKSIIDVPAVLDSVIDKFLTSDIQVLLIPGDLTKDGEKQSHLDLVDKLSILRKKGVLIYVIPGNHDINMPNSVGYKDDHTYRVENITPQEFTHIYADYGYANTLDRDSSSLSYLATLDNNTWLLAIDASKYEEYKDKSISGGRIKPETEAWIVDVLQKAKRENKQIIAMMHQGLVEHFPMQATFFKDYLVEDRIRLADLFADNGLQMIFTGHFHANDITEYISQTGNKIYDIETGSLSAYPFPYRFVQLSNKQFTVTTHHITTTSNNLLLAQKNKQQLKEQAQKSALSMIRNFGIELPDSIKNNISEIAAEFMIKHVEGDEVIDDEMRQSIQRLSTFFDDDYSSYIENLNIDFYPADNNVLIQLGE